MERGLFKELREYIFNGFEFYFLDVVLRQVVCFHWLLFFLTNMHSLSVFLKKPSPITSIYNKLPRVAEG